MKLYIQINTLVIRILKCRYLRGNTNLLILVALFLLLITGCITKFIPVTEEDKELLVVQGLITDQPETDTIKLSKSLPLGELSAARPVTGCNVTISDDIGNIYSLSENEPGTYITDPAVFRGIIGRVYTLHISTGSDNNNFTYESYPVKMIPVPPIDSIYYEKKIIEPPSKYFQGADGCQIYLNTYDPSDSCKYYRWDFSETWVVRLPFPVANQICWITNNSNNINIKSTAALNEARIDRFPINYISNNTDRLKTKYSILVNQYSMTEDEYKYWEKIQNVAVQVGGLYDIIPASVSSNINCIENPGETVLGFFSVSARTSKRIFIKDNFPGIINLYSNCIKDTIPYIDPPGLGVSVWILDDEQFMIPPYKITTDIKGCADCTVRGTNIEPDFWVDDK